jgi:hypothetical protein
MSSSSGVGNGVRGRGIVRRVAGVVVVALTVQVLVAVEVV